LRNGGVMMMVNTVEGALWVKTEGKEGIIGKMGGTVTMKEKTIKVIVDFVPVEFDPSNESTIREIEQYNGLEDRSIASANFFKKIIHRDSWQKTATLIIAMRSAEQANRMLEGGIAIMEEELNVRKKVVEPDQCNNCQEPGHHAGVCKKAMCCSKCGGEGHNFRSCRNTARNTYECRNCGGKGHGPRDDERCPWYIEEIRRLGERFPCNNRRLFATEDP
ncbi:hypothetical protein BJ165DRAFT_1324942, partial [Panaeolus papilionaceus]